MATIFDNDDDGDDFFDDDGVRSWLFNVTLTDEERDDLRSAHPDVLRAATARLDAALREAAEPYDPDTSTRGAAYRARGGIGSWDPDGADEFAVGHTAGVQQGCARERHVATAARCRGAR